MMTAATRLVSAGGMLTPNRLAMHYFQEEPRRTEAWDPMLYEAATTKLVVRDREVVSSQRVRKPNKAVAIDVDTSESTVKVHIRNVMTKKNAANRGTGGALHPDDQTTRAVFAEQPTPSDATFQPPGIRRGGSWWQTDEPFLPSSPCIKPVPATTLYFDRSLVIVEADTVAWLGSPTYDSGYQNGDLNTPEGRPCFCERAWEQAVQVK